MNHSSETYCRYKVRATSSMVFLLFISVLCLTLPSRALADYVFSKIVDSATVRPGTADLFNIFSEVYYDGANVAFIGSGVSGTKGVFRWNGTQLSTVADTSTAVPNTGGTFSDFRSLSLDGGAVAFISLGSVVDGVYTTLGGPLRRVADATTIMPGSSVPFTDFEFGPDVEISGNRIAFTAFGTNGFSIFNEGAYLEQAGALQVVADRSDAIPDFAGNFIFFSEVDVDETGVVFSAGRGSGGGNGFYTTNAASAGSYRVVYNSTRPLPGLTQPNSIFSPNSIRMDGGKVAFEARGANDFGAIFIDDGGTIETVVSTDTPDPVTGSDFRDFFSYTFDNGQAAFMGFSTGATGLYRYANGSLEKVINTFDFLDGKDVNSISLSPGGLNGGSIAFRAGFTDGSSAIYLATSETTGDVQTITLEPTVDVQLTPGNVFTIQEGSATLDIDGGFGTSIPAKDVLMEFPLDQIPHDAEILSVKLSLDGMSSSGSVSIVVDGYAGDGLASTSDATALTTELAVSSPYTASSNISIDLQTAFVEAIHGSATHLGLRLSSLNINPILTIASLESPSGVPPMLTIEYQVPLSQAGNFDGDGDVDGRDFLAWQRGESPNPLSSGDLADWQANYGIESPATAILVPEPANAAMSLIILISAVSRRNQTAGRRRPLACSDPDRPGELDSIFLRRKTPYRRQILLDSHSFRLYWERIRLARARFEGSIELPPGRIVKLYGCVR